MAGLTRPERPYATGEQMMVARPLAAKKRDILPACSFRRYHMDTIMTKAGVMEASKLLVRSLV
jgi:hypothetical protein